MAYKIVKRLVDEDNLTAINPGNLVASYTSSARPCRRDAIAGFTAYYGNLPNPCITNSSTNFNR